MEELSKGLDNSISGSLYNEALVRFKAKDGKIKNPYFIDKLEEAGFVHSIDLWVVK